MHKNSIIMLISDTANAFIGDNHEEWYINLHDYRFKFSNKIINITSIYILDLCPLVGNKL